MSHSHTRTAAHDFAVRRIGRARCSTLSTVFTDSALPTGESELCRKIPEAMLLNIDITGKQCVLFCNTEMNSSRGANTQLAEMSSRLDAADSCAGGYQRTAPCVASGCGAHLRSLAALFLISLFLHAVQLIVRACASLPLPSPLDTSVTPPLSLSSLSLCFL